MRRLLTSVVLFVALFLGTGILVKACDRVYTSGPCADPACICWTLTSYCYGEGFSLECTISGGFCDYGDVTVLWSTDLVCT